VWRKLGTVLHSQKRNDSKSLKTSGEPGRTRTCNPLIKSQLLYH
jgi:hypothetical protein